MVYQTSQIQVSLSHGSIQNYTYLCMVGKRKKILSHFWM